MKFWELSNTSACLGMPTATDTNLYKTPALSMFCKHCNQIMWYSVHQFFTTSLHSTFSSHYFRPNTIVYSYSCNHASYHVIYLKYQLSTVTQDLSDLKKDVSDLRAAVTGFKQEFPHCVGTVTAILILSIMISINAWSLLVENGMLLLSSFSSSILFKNDLTLSSIVLWPSILLSCHPLILFLLSNSKIYLQS